METTIEYVEKSLESIRDQLMAIEDSLLRDNGNTSKEKFLHEHLSEKIRMQLTCPLTDVRFFVQRILDAERKTE